MEITAATWGAELRSGRIRDGIFYWGVLQGVASTSYGQKFSKESASVAKRGVGRRRNRCGIPARANTVFFCDEGYNLDQKGLICRADPRRPGLAVGIVEGGAVELRGLEEYKQNQRSEHSLPHSGSGRHLKL